MDDRVSTKFQEWCVRFPEVSDVNRLREAWRAAWREALARRPVADEPPMAKMANALREKARQERQAYQDRRDQATEWGPIPAGTEADAAPVAGEAQAWMHENDPTRVISAQQKAQAERDGGAYASSLRPYTIPLSRDAAPQASSAPVAFSKDGVLFWYGDHAARRGFNGDLYLAPLASEAVGDADIPASLAQLVAAVKGMTKLYPHVWDRTDGGLVVFPENVVRFDAAFDALRIAVGEAVDDDESAALSAQSVLSSGAPNGRKRTAAERRAPMVERVYGAGVTAQPAQKEQSE